MDQPTVCRCEDSSPGGDADLGRLWCTSVGACARSAGDTRPDWGRDVALLDRLGVSIEETFRHLMVERPTLDAFENWVRERRDGTGRLATAARTSSDPPLSDAELAFFERSGYVVARGVVPREWCMQAEIVVWEHLGANPDVPSTWYDRADIWVDLYRHPAIDSIRDHPEVHQAFEQIWRRSELIASADRCGFNPPETATWPFPGPNLHLDVDLDHLRPFGVQGLVYLADCAADQGAFTCVPGVHTDVQGSLDRGLAEWLSSERLERLDGEPVPGRAGDLVIWNQALPHGSSPNRADRPRIVQYLTIYPADRRRGPAGEAVSAGSTG